MISIEILQSFCAEAAELFGDDWAAVTQYVVDRLGSMMESDRLDLLAAVDQILKSDAPGAPAQRRLQ